MSSCLRPQRLIFWANHALLLYHVLEVACECCARNGEQLRCASLIAICLLVNESDVPFHGTCQRKIGAWLFVVVRQRTSDRWLARSRRLIGFEIGWKNDILGKNDRAIAKQSHGPH